MENRLLALTAFLVVLLLAAPDAWAQGGRRGGGGRAGGHRQPQGRGQRPERPQAQQGPRDGGQRGQARRERPNPDAQKREQLAAKRGELEAALAQKGLSAEQIESLKSQLGQVVSEEQKANLEALATDLQQIQSESEVTQEMVQDLSTSLQAMADGATKPSEESVNELATDLSTALDDGNLTAMEQAALVKDVEAVLSSANISTEDALAAMEDAKTILEASNVDQADVEKILADLQAIYDEMNIPQ